MASDEVTVFTAQGEMEARQIVAFLGAHGIPSRIHGEALRLTHGLTLDGLGQAEVRVPRDHAAAAMDLLARADRGELALHELPETDADG